MVKAETVNLMVPAHCEIVIEGVVPPKNGNTKAPSVSGRIITIRKASSPISR